MIKLIAAYDKNRGMGYKNSLPWNLPSELKRVSKITRHSPDSNKQNALIMGRNTFESIPENRRPLKDRLNVVISKNLHSTENFLVFNDIQSAINNLLSRSDIFDIYIFGGQKIYKEALESNWLEEILITEINKEFNCDIFFPEIPKSFKLTEQEDTQIDDTLVSYKIYSKINLN